MIDAVLFDLDGTICEYRRPGPDVLSAAFETVGVDPFFSFEDYVRVIDDHVEGTTTVAEGRAAGFAALARDRGRDPAVGRAVARAYESRRDHADVAPLDGALEAVAALDADHRMGLVTNGAPGMQAEKLASLGLFDRFGTVVHAGYDPGVPSKPATAPFDRALEALDVPAARAVHVGNSLSADVAGARAAGVRSAWLANGHATDGVIDPAPDYVLASLHDLVPPPWRA